MESIAADERSFVLLIFDETHSSKKVTAGMEVSKSKDGDCEGVSSSVVNTDENFLLNITAQSWSVSASCESLVGLIAEGFEGFKTCQNCLGFPSSRLGNSLEKNKCLALPTNRK